MRPIDADKMLLELDCERRDSCKGCRFFPVGDGLCIHDEIEEWVNEQPTVELPRWIPVEESLPDAGEKVFTWRKNDRVRVEIYWDTSFLFDSLGYNPVTHWMPEREDPRGGH